MAPRQQDPPPPNDSFQGEPLSMARFTMVKKLGQGSFGTAMKVTDAAGEAYCIKLVDLSSLHRAEKSKAFREVEVMKKLGHPSIVACHGAWVEDLPMYGGQTLCILMELCEGGELEQHLKRLAKSQSFIPQDMIMEWFVQLADALVFIHGHRLIHRDIKPMNVFMAGSLEDLAAARQAVPKLGDFGLAKDFGKGRSIANTCAGTPDHMAPEVLQSQKGYSYRSDVWAMGCVLHEMCSNGRRPFRIKSWAQAYHAVMEGNYDRLNPDMFSPGLCDLIDSMLDRDAVTRPNMAEVLAREVCTQAVQRLEGRGVVLPAFRALAQARQVPRTMAPAGTAEGDVSDDLAQMAAVACAKEEYVEPIVGLRQEMGERPYLALYEAARAAVTTAAGDVDKEEAAMQLLARTYGDAAVMIVFGDITKNDAFERDRQVRAAIRSAMARAKGDLTVEMDGVNALAAEHGPMVHRVYTKMKLQAALDLEARSHEADVASAHAKLASVQGATVAMSTRAGAVEKGKADRCTEAVQAVQRLRAKEGDRTVDDLLLHVRSAYNSSLGPTGLDQDGFEARVAGLAVQHGRNSAVVVEYVQLFMEAHAAARRAYRCGHEVSLLAESYGVDLMEDVLVDLAEGRTLAERVRAQPAMQELARNPFLDTSFNTMFDRARRDYQTVTLSLGLRRMDWTGHMMTALSRHGEPARWVYKAYKARAELEDFREQRSEVFADTKAKLEAQEAKVKVLSAMDQVGIEPGTRERVEAAYFRAARVKDLVGQQAFTAMCESTRAMLEECRVSGTDPLDGLGTLIQLHGTLVLVAREYAQTEREVHTAVASALRAVQWDTKKRDDILATLAPLYGHAACLASFSYLATLLAKDREVGQAMAKVQGAGGLAKFWPCYTAMQQAYARGVPELDAAMPALRVTYHGAIVDAAHKAVLTLEPTPDAQEPILAGAAEDEDALAAQRDALTLLRLEGELLVMLQPGQYEPDWQAVSSFLDCTTAEPKAMDGQWQALVATVPVHHALKLMRVVECQRALGREPSLHHEDDLDTSSVHRVSAVVEAWEASQTLLGPDSAADLYEAVRFAFSDTGHDMIAAHEALGALVPLYSGRHVAAAVMYVVVEHECYSVMHTAFRACNSTGDHEKALRTVQLQYGLLASLVYRAVRDDSYDVSARRELRQVKDRLGRARFEQLYREAQAANAACAGSDYVFEARAEHASASYGTSDALLVFLEVRKGKLLAPAREHHAAAMAEVQEQIKAAEFKAVVAQVLARAGAGRGSVEQVQTAFRDGARLRERLGQVEYDGLYNKVRAIMERCAYNKQSPAELIRRLHELHGPVVHAVRGLVDAEMTILPTVAQMLAEIRGNAAKEAQLVEAVSSTYGPEASTWAFSTANRVLDRHASLARQAGRVIDKDGYAAYAWAYMDVRQQAARHESSHAAMQALAQYYDASVLAGVSSVVQAMEYRAHHHPQDRPDRCSRCSEGTVDGEEEEPARRADRKTGQRLYLDLVTRLGEPRFQQYYGTVARLYHRYHGLEGKIEKHWGSITDTVPLQDAVKILRLLQYERTAGGHGKARQ